MTAAATLDLRAALDAHAASERHDAENARVDLAVDDALAGLQPELRRRVLEKALRQTSFDPETELTPPFLRDLRSLEDFLGAHPLEASYVDRSLLLRLYMRASAVCFSGGGMGSLRDQLDVMQEIRTRLVVARFIREIRGAEAMERIIGRKSFCLDIWMHDWFKAGCPRIKLRREEAAALALTDMPDGFADARSAPHAPWGAFMLDVPPGSLRIADGDAHLDVDRILMLRIETETAAFWITMIGSGAEVLGIANVMLGLAEDDARRTFYRSGERLVPEIAGRGILAAARIAAGACYALENKVADGSLRVRRPSPPSRVGGPPLTTDYRLGLAIAVDFSDALADFTLHRKTSARKSQWVVRGHWRNQAHGAGNTQRRRQWIKPFWKGPAHLPILVRAHALPEKSGGAS